MFRFLAHLLVGYALLLMIGSSLIVSMARDPGPVKSLEEIEAGNAQASGAQGDGEVEDEEDISLADALLSRNEGSAEGFALTPLKSNGENRWCRKVSSIDTVSRLCRILNHFDPSVGHPSPRGRTIAANAIDVF